MPKRILDSFSSLSCSSSNCSSSHSSDLFFNFFDSLFNSPSPSLIAIHNLSLLSPLLLKKLIQYAKHTKRTTFLAFTNFSWVSPVRKSFFLSLGFLQFHYQPPCSDRKREENREDCCNRGLRTVWKSDIEVF